MNKRQREQRRRNANQRQRRTSQPSRFPDRYDVPAQQSANSRQRRPSKNAEKKKTSRHQGKLDKRIKIIGGLLLLTATLICFMVLFVPTNLYPNKLMPLTEMQTETISIIVASVAISFLVFTTSPRSELFVRAAGWFIAAAGYFVSLWAFQDKHPIGMLVHIVAVLMVIASLMAVSIPGKNSQKLYWAITWLVGVTVLLAVMDATVYGIVLQYAIGQLYLLIGAVVVGSLIFGAFLLFGMGTAQAAGNITKRDTWGPNAW